ncbi:MAG: hypothetical protein DWC07_00915 [Candidatus Poseidoniales archaeon]|nr:MAG: hypothetical protein DWC07_00915 [Candidatus Poseidoniales archaeon]
MRWWVLVTILVAPLFASMVPAEAMPVSNDNLEAVSEENVIVHPGEAVTTYVTVHNTASVTQTVTIDVVSNHTDLTVLGLPTSANLAANHLHQFTFEVMASNASAFQSSNITFHITGDVDTDAVLSVNMSVRIAPYSNLSWGVNGISQFVVDETVRTSVAVNMTNNAERVDNVTFSLSSPSSWSWGWNMDSNTQGQAVLNLTQGETGYVYLWVDVPEVLDGAPLAGTGPRFTLTGVSGLDLAAHTWQFDLLMNEKRNVSIDHVDSNLTLSPTQDGRAQITVRNVGNTVNTLNISMVAVDEDGQVLPGMTRSDRFNVSGWTVALFGGLEDVPLSPNESRVVEVGIQAPYELTGELRVKLIVFAQGASLLQRETTVQATIVRTTGAEFSVEHQGCDDLNEINSCAVETTVTNTGNSFNTFTVRISDVTDGFNTSVGETDRAFFLRGQQKELAVVTVVSRPELLAFTRGTMDLEVVDDTGRVVAAQSVNLRVSPLIRWNLTVVDETVDRNGRLSMAFEVRNDGNAADGLMVQLQSSHAVEMGLVPPEGAVYEDGVVEPRSMEINTVPIGSTFTLRAWAELPQDQSSNGTMYLNTTLRSRYTPEDMFVHTTEADYLGTPWQPLGEDDEASVWAERVSLSLAYLEAWAGVLLASAFSFALVVVAVRARQRRRAENTLMPYQRASETADDWMAKFNPGPSEPATPPGIEPASTPDAIHKEDYARQFRQQHGHAAVQQTPVNPQLVNAAQLVLEKRTEERELQRADDLLNALQAGQIASPMLDIAPPVEVTEPPATSMPSQTKPGTTTTNTPPIWQDDDLDF